MNVSAISGYDYQNKNLKFSANNSRDNEGETKSISTPTKWAIGAGLAVLAAYGIVHVCRAESIPKLLGETFDKAEVTELGGLSSKDICTAIKKELEGAGKKFGEIVFCDSTNFNEEFLKSKNLDKNCFGVVAFSGYFPVKSWLYKYSDTNKPIDLLEKFKKNEFVRYD